MRNTDIFIELIRLAEQAGTVVKASMNESGTCWIEVQGLDGDIYSFAMQKEENNDH